MLFFFFFNDTATTEIYTLSLHDALPILSKSVRMRATRFWTSTGRRSFRVSSVSSSEIRQWTNGTPRTSADRKSTRLNSSHSQISYAVFCLKKKKKKKKNIKNKKKNTDET